MIGHQSTDALLGGRATGQGDRLQVFGHEPVQAKDLSPDPTDLFLLRRRRFDHGPQHPKWQRIVSQTRPRPIKAPATSKAKAVSITALAERG